MNYYRKDQLEIMSDLQLDKTYTPIKELTQDVVYYLYEDDHKEAMGIHRIEDDAFYKTHRESLIGKLCQPANKEVIGINLKKVSLPETLKKKPYRLHVLGLGDVGGMMLSALRLIGGDCLEAIGIFDLDENKVKRWCYELNQIMTIDRGPYPPVYGVSMDDLFECDAFVFTASSRIPEVGSDVKDVRMYQLEANTKIISIYAKMAKERNFQGQFIVVSDPVDLLCRAVLSHGLRPEQIKGFGLGVMHARACYYSERHDMDYYKDQGRAFGPHGKHLIIADSIDNYNQKKSLFLTDKTVKANLDVRAVGYKPFIAPALSSAAMSILAYLEGKPHYSTVYVDGVYFGCKNRVDNLVYVHTEKNDLPEQLLERLTATYEELKSFEF
ncbi:lactate dehydrogenase [Acidaminobacter sp. JC074]|uniref:lactate dehydrogenase n=1 Tax=Acidaminobacter sp. JC074 TaxID=2530199 RepID=UPI001F0F5E69|nr:lactate dehydrogenase [Acidaminobacter sp. JC074]MCH4888667.1 lactate dehydrogenase [Acidaminobacter sp. JC074]